MSQPHDSHVLAVVKAILLVGTSIFVGLFSFGLLATVFVSTAIRHWWGQRRDGDEFEVVTASIALVLTVAGSVGVWWMWDDYARWKVGHPGAGGPVGPYTDRDRVIGVLVTVGIGLAAAGLGAFVRAFRRTLKVYSLVEH